MSPSLELIFPARGLDKSQRLAVQPPDTSRDLVNVMPTDATTGRLRGGQRAGTSQYLSGYVSGVGNKVQAFGALPYQSRHLDYDADAVPNEQFAVVFDGGPTVSSIARGLNDDFFVLINNRRLVHYSRYGVELGSAELSDVDPDYTNGALHVATDTGGIYVARQFGASAHTGVIYKYVLGNDNESLEFVWSTSGLGSELVAGMRAVGDSLWTFETGDDDTCKLCEYMNANTADGPIGGDRFVRFSFKASDIDTLDSGWPGGGGGDPLFAHDMDMRTSPEYQWVVAVGTVQGSTAGVWAQLKITKTTAGAYQITAPYCIISNEVLSSTVAPLRGGGIGLACRFDQDGNVISMGRGATGDANGGIWLRRLQDTGTAWTQTGGWERYNATDLGGAAQNPDYGYPVLAVDQYGNAFAPTANDNTAGVSAVKVVKTDGTLFTSIVHYEDVTNPGVPTAVVNECRGVALPTTSPIYHEDDYKIADTVFTVGSAVDTLTTDDNDTGSIQGYDILLETPLDVSSRNVANIVVAAGNVFRFTTAGTQTPENDTGRSPPLSAASQFVQCADAFGELFITDGLDYCVYKPSPPLSVATYPNGRLVNWAADSLGVIPPRCRLIARWRGRIVLAHSADSPYAWHMSAFSNPYDWDTAPPERLATQAVDYLAVPQIGSIPRPVHALVPWSDDLMFFGCSGMIQRLDGDPMFGGKLSVVSDQTGMAFGTPWCKDPEGRIYFFGDKGGVYVMTPAGELAWMTRDTIEKDLSDVDLSVNRVELIWNSRDNGLHVWILPLGDGGTHLRHYFWSQRTEGWFPIEMGTATVTAMQPTATTLIDGDDPDERVMLLGTEDGRVLKWDPNVAGDDGAPINSRVLIGPLAGIDGGFETRFERPAVVLASELGSANIRFFASDTPETPDLPASSVRVGSGFNALLPIRCRGSWAWSEIQSCSRTNTLVPVMGEKWSLESFLVDASPGGRKRARRRG